MILNKHIALHEVMTKDFITLHPEDSLQKADKIFSKYDIHHVPIVEKDKVIGIINKSDFYNIEESFALFDIVATGYASTDLYQHFLTKEVMTEQFTSLHPKDTLPMAMKLFDENPSQAIPIINKKEQLVGMVTTYDLLIFIYQESTCLLVNYN